MILRCWFCDERMLEPSDNHPFCSRVCADGWEAAQDNLWDDPEDDDLEAASAKWMGESPGITWDDDDDLEDDPEVLGLSVLETAEEWVGKGVPGDKGPYTEGDEEDELWVG